MLFAISFTNNKDVKLLPYQETHQYQPTSPPYTLLCKLHHEIPEGTI